MDEPGAVLPAFIISYFSNSYSFSLAEAGSEVKAGGGFAFSAFIPMDVPVSENPISGSGFGLASK